MTVCRVSLRALVLMLSVALPATAQAQDKRPWTVQDSFRTKSIGDLRAAPDGDRVLFVVSGRNLEANASWSGIWIWSEDAPQPRALTATDGSAFSPRWSPDGETVAYFARVDGKLGL